MTHDGWRDVRAMAAESIAENEDHIKDLMLTPDKLTGKTAIARANRARGVRDLMEEIESAHNFAPQPVRAGDR